MSKEIECDDDMRPEYDFSNAKPNPYLEAFRRNGHRVLDPDVRDAFPDSAAVNAALREVIEAKRRAQVGTAPQKTTEAA